MTKTKIIKIKEIKDPKTKVKVNSGWNRIEEIKAEIANLNTQRELCEVPVLEMWEESLEER